VKLERAVIAMLLSGALSLPVMAQMGAGSSSPSAGAPQDPRGSTVPSDTSSQDNNGNKGKKGTGDATNTRAGNAGDMNMRTVARKDRMFMEKAAMGGMAEVDLGNAAKEKAQSQDVKDFGNRMVEDHSKANDELKALMTQKGLGVPDTIPAKDKSEGDKIKGKSGADFDKAYMSHMVKDHDKDVKEFQDEAKNGTDPDVKAWAQKTVSVLQEHDKMAHDIAQKVGAGGKSSGKSGDKGSGDKQ
jgi:putative membrane protein